MHPVYSILPSFPGKDRSELAISPWQDLLINLAQAYINNLTNILPLRKNSDLI